MLRRAAGVAADDRAAEGAELIAEGVELFYARSLVAVFAGVVDVDEVEAQGDVVEVHAEGFDFVAAGVDAAEDYPGDGHASAVGALVEADGVGELADRPGRGGGDQRA